jgi:hypothetical protein
VLNGSLYVIGGGNQSEWLADCRRLDLRGGGWHKLPALSALRGCAGAAPLGGRLYVAGGGTADDQYNSVEIFNPEINAWMPGGWAVRACCAVRVGTSPIFPLPLVCMGGWLVVGWVVIVRGKGGDGFALVPIFQV